MNNETHALLSLQNMPNLGDASIKKLIQKVGSAAAVLKEKKSNLLKIDGIGTVKLTAIHDKKHLLAAEKELSFVEKQNISITIYNDDDYPQLLKRCKDGPVVLFSSGKMNLQNQKIISIVGTRKNTSYGIRFCEEFIENLKPYNPIIVSGFAYGTDIVAHKNAIKNNLQTIACLAHGLNQIYPKTHKKYMNSMEENGGFFTDFWSTDPFSPQNFLRRNRIIAGLSEATIVIESAEKGGSLVTAQIANSYFRDVFAVPGRVNDVFSKGCNMLIKTQQAHTLTNATDLIYLLNWKNEIQKPKAIQKSLFVELSEIEKKIYNFLKIENKSDIDNISLKCNIPTYLLAGILLQMELKELIEPLPGKLFQLR